MRKLLLLSLFFMFLGCPVKYAETVVPAKGTVVNINDARFVIVEGCVPESTKIRIETFQASGVYKKHYDNGFIFTGKSITIKPESLFFEKPVLFSQPVKNTRFKLAARIGKGFVPLAGSSVEGESLQAKIRHGGEYYIIETPEKYGILNHSQADSALLIVSDIYVSDHLKNFQNVLKEKGYTYPVWTFIYSGDNSIEEDAKILAENLKKLHEQYGKFRLDVVSFGIGGLITHRYVADEAESLYQKDVSSAIIAIGTPIKGSNFASMDSAKKSSSPFRFFFIDGLGDNAWEIIPGSKFLSWINDNSLFLGNFEEPEEVKNFASIRGVKNMLGKMIEETEGDGLISFESTFLTPIEPKPFPFDHFELFEQQDVQRVVANFVLLYRSFTWPSLFSKVWNGEETVSKICMVWEKEARLTYPGVNFEILLEWAENILRSAPQDAILFTNGDNDTYPLWYLQEKGIRKDVLIANRSLLNLTSYVKFLIGRGLPLQLSSDEIDKFSHYRDKKNKEVVTISDQLIRLLIAQKERPAVFSTTCYSPEKFGAPLNLSGVVYEINTNGTKVGDKYVNIEKTSELLFKTFSYAKFLSTPPESVYLDLQSLQANQAMSAFFLAMALKTEKKYQEAFEAFLLVKKLNRLPKYKHIVAINEALLYAAMGDTVAADNTFKEMLNTTLDCLQKKVIAETYSNWGMKKEAVKILAECLKENPEDTTITNLIKKYQEKK